MRCTGSRRRAVALVAVGALTLGACGGGDEDAPEEAAEAVEDDQAGDVEDAEGEDGADGGGDDGGGDTAAEEGSDGAGGEAGSVAANGSVTVDGEEHPLETAYRCPARETFEGDGEIVLHTFVYAADDAYGVNVWERVEDGVSSHMVSSDAPGLNSLAEHVAEEGSDDYPLLEVDGDRVSVRAMLSQEGGTGEQLEVLAEWDLPADTLPELRC